MPRMFIARATRLLALSLGLLISLGEASAAITSPSLIIHHAVVLSQDPTNLVAEAVAVLQGRIVAIGTDTEVLALRGPNTRVVDAGGRTLVPGFNDAHLHPRAEYPEDSIHAEVDLDPERVPDRAAVVAALRRKAERTPPGQWVRGFNYQDTKLGGHPDRDLLDGISTQHPILLRHSSGHLWAVNSVVLKAARLTAETPDPAGGSLGRRDDGEPNGLLREPPALRLVEAAGPKTSEPAWEEQLDAYQRCLDNFLAEGITSITDAAGTPERLRIYQDLARRKPRIRVNVLMQAAYLDRMEAAGLQSGWGNDWVRLAGIKVVHGNSLSGRTCWLSKPYDRINPANGQRDYFGIPPARSQDELDALILRIHRAGLQPAVHANGDREITMVLDAFERALTARPLSDHRFRIEHASVNPPELQRRAKALGVVFALHSYIYEHGDKLEEYGSWRWDFMHPNASADALGIVVAGNSDFPVSAAKPMRRVQSLVTRATAAGKVYGASQQVSVETALRMWTVGGAYATRQESDKGSIRPGLLADFVLLAADPRKVAPTSIKDVRVEATFVGGEMVYARPGFPTPR